MVDKLLLVIAANVVIFLFILFLFDLILLEKSIRFLLQNMFCPCQLKIFVFRCQSGKKIVTLHF